MTVEKLNELFYIKKNIERLDDEIRRLRESAEPRSPDTSGNTRVPSVSNRFDELVPEIVDKKIERAALAAELEEIEAWVRTLRRRDQLVIRYRYEQKMSWRQIAEKIGDGATTESVKRAHYRCMKSR